MPGFLTDQRIDADALMGDVAASFCGATALFLGTVRRSAEDGDIDGIEYSAYPEMAEAEFARIVDEARGRWRDARIAIRHRTGFIPTGEASIGVAVATAHRAEAYECSRFLIDEIKTRVPIWKKETLGSGEGRWVEPRQAAHA
jgi:molybdopterin synthase catalytic subunit